MIKIGFNILVISILLGCNQKNNDVVLDMNDINPKSEKHTDKEEYNLPKETIDNGFYLSYADEVGLNIQGFCPFETALFPDRFAPKKSIKLTLLRDNDSIVFCQWTYKDSTHTKNALYNWLDCFGPKCRSIKLGEKTNFQKENLILLVSDTSLTYISSLSKLDSDDWMNYFTLKSDIMNWDLLIEQKRNGKATWYNVVEGKKNEKHYVTH